MEDIAHAETDKLISEMERKIAREYRQAADEAQRKLDDYLSKFAKRDEQWRIAVDKGEKSEEDYEKWRVNQMMTGKRWEAMRDTLAEDYHNANLIARSVVNGYTPDAYALNHNYGTYLIEHDSMMDTSYTLYNRQTVERILREDPQLLPEPGKELQKKIEANKDLKWQEGQIQSVTMQSILQGDSIPKMAKRISETMGDKNCGNAVAYARTAMTGAQNAGRHDSYVRAKNMGIDVVQMWLATLDDRTRDAHRQLDGQTVGPNEAFEVDGAQLDYPGDPSAPAYLVWNCRCTTVPQIKGFEWSASDMSLRYNEKLGDMSYDEWKEEKANTDIKRLNIDKVINNARAFTPEEHEEKQRSRIALEILPDEEQRAIEKYSETFFTQINGALREQDEIPEPVQKVVDRLTSAVNKFEIKDDTILYRGGFSSKTGAEIFGVSTDDFKKMLSDGSIVGQTFMDKGFCSTTVTSNIPLPKEVNLRIFAPAGTKGVYIDPISSGINEKEMLLQRGTKFEVVNAWVEDIRGRGKYTRQFLDVVIIDQN